MFLQRFNNKGIRLGTLLERAASRHPHTMLVLDHDLDVAPDFDRRATVAQVADLVDDLAARLSAADVRPGDRVAIHKSQGFDITLLACAAARIGAVPALLSPHLDGETVAELLDRLDGPCLITDQVKLDQELPSRVCAPTRRVLLASGEHPDATNLATLAGSPRIAPVTQPPQHPTLITHTSGTTGTPKLAVHTGYTLNARHRLQITLFRALRRRHTVAAHVSFVHSRMFTALSVPISRGFPLLILAHGEPEHVARIFADERPGFIETHPNSYLEWEDLADHPLQPMSQVKVFSSTFDAIHPRTVQRLVNASAKRWPIFFQILGQSECGPLICRGYTRNGAHKMDGRCVGFPVPGMTSVRVMSRDGQRPTAQSPGDIEVRTDGRILTYLGEQQRYDRQRHNRWWRMGDVGYRSRWGCLHMLDREIDMIPGFGSTLAVEDHLLGKLPELSEVVVVRTENGAPTPVVTTKNDQPLDRAAWQHATRNLPAMSEPVQWQRSELPQTGTMKTKRLELAQVVGNPESE